MSMSNVLSRRTLTLTSTTEVTEAWLKGYKLVLQEQIEAEVTITSLGTDTWQMVIESAGTDDMDIIIDIACDLQRDLGTATTDIQLVDSYGEVILGDDYVGD